MLKSRSNQPPPCLAVVIPCYNEEDILPQTLDVLSTLLSDFIKSTLISDTSYILCVDDGSNDNTWEIINSNAMHSSYVRGLKLSRNYGHQNALLAGLANVADGEVIVSIDADMQDDPQVIRDMLVAWSNEYDIVYGVRNDRQSDTVFKRETAKLFYKLMKFMGVDLVPDHADFRLLDRRALDALLEYNERNIFLRGLVPLVGFLSTNVYYARKSRIAGESKYPLKKMLGLAVQGVTSFSIMPLRIIAVGGLLISTASVLAIIYILFDKINGHVIRGWTSITIAIFFMGGVQMLSLGVIGEYIGKIYIETKRRPRFHVENKTEI